MDLIERGRNIVSMPYKVGDKALHAGRQVLAECMETVLKVPPKEELVEELRQTNFDNDLAQAAATYELGRKRKDPELGFLGAGWMLKLMCKADNDPKIPSRKVEQIAHRVLEENLDPMLEPLVDDEEAAHAAELLDKHNPVTEVFFSSEK